MLATRLFSIVKPQGALATPSFKQFFGVHSVYFNRSSSLLKQQFTSDFGFSTIIPDRSLHRLFSTTTTNRKEKKERKGKTSKSTKSHKRENPTETKTKVAKEVVRAIDYTKKIEENQKATSNLVAIAKVVPLNPPKIYPIPSKLNDSIIEFNTQVEENKLIEKLKPLPDSFAVVALSGKQYKLTEGDILQTDKLTGAVPGAIIYLEKVLLVGSRDKTYLGTPLIPNARVEVEVQEQTKAEKIIIFKMKRRKNYRRTRGFRPSVTVLKINNILFNEDLYPNTTFEHHFPQTPILDITEKRIQEINKGMELVMEKIEEKKAKRAISRKGMDKRFVRV